MSIIRPLLVFGTRPEAIKMAPVIRACEAHKRLDPVSCATGQHRELLEQVYAALHFRPDIELSPLTADRSLAGLTARLIEAMDRVLVDVDPDWLVTQGDTTTTFAAALSAYYRGIPILHLEAGLRSGDMRSPWPEEFNRSAVSLIATVHAAPTANAAANLRRIGVAEDAILVSGNTSVDSLRWMLDRLPAGPREGEGRLVDSQPMVLVTVHRRENHGPPLDGILAAVGQLAGRHPRVAFVIPMHPHPEVLHRIESTLQGRPNVHLLPAVDYAEFVALLARCRFVMTDSGGVQEEAPTLRKPVLILRKVTERPEAVDAGGARLVGTETATIIRHAEELLGDDEACRAMEVAENPFGDGAAADRIVDAIVSRSETHP